VSGKSRGGRAVVGSAAEEFVGTLPRHLIPRYSAKGLRFEPGYGIVRMDISVPDESRGVRARLVWIIGSFFPTLRRRCDSSRSGPVLQDTTLGAVCPSLIGIIP